MDSRERGRVRASDCVGGIRGHGLRSRSRGRDKSSPAHRGRVTPDAVDIEPLDVPREGIPDVTHEDIDDAVAALTAGHGPFSIDTERAMGIRYSARAYLVQIRREGAGTFLIDPVGIEDRLGPLAEALAADQWILHAADQDLPSLREIGLNPPDVFDTEVAGILLGLERVSL